MPASIAILLGVVCAIAATIALFVLVLPENKVGTLGKFPQFLHDIFNFKVLFLKQILQALYVLCTCLSIFIGFFLLFSVLFYGLDAVLLGLALLLLGPVLLRIIYELLLLLILMSKHLMQIDQKMDALFLGEELEQPEAAFQAAENTLAEPAFAKSEDATCIPCFRFCTQCGTRYDTTQGDCPNCGKR